MAKKTFLEIRQQIEKLELEAADARKAESADVLARIKEAIAVYGFTAADLGLGKATGKGVKAAKKGAPSAKYRDDKGNSWGGRGPRPVWLRTAIADGKSLEDFLA